MNTIIKALTIAGVAAIALGGTAAYAASANANASAKILKQVTVTKTADLDFGTIVTGVAPSTVAIAADGTRTCGVGLTCSQTATATSFVVTGSNNTVVNVTTPSTVTLNSGANTLVATLSAPSTLNLGNSGSTGTALKFGGTLAVGANQADGVYVSNDFAVTVDYQ